MATWHPRTSVDPIHAGFWRRCAARLIDSLIVGAISSALISVLRAVFDADGALSWIGDLEGLVIGWLYFASQESSAARATLGKRLMGLKVTDAHGERIGFGRATFRFLAQLLSAAIAGIGFMMAGWTARKQALHDILAGTLVVFREANSGPQRTPAERPPMPWYGWAINIAGFALASYLVAGVALTTVTYGAYLTRAQFLKASTHAELAKLAIDDFYTEAKRCPESSAEAGFDEEAESDEAFHIAIEPECHVAIEFADSTAVKSPLRGRRIDMTMAAPAGESESPTWRCTSTVYASYRPATCRD
ncbi:MAG TPA: RDD family protein [Rhodanobacteraceae bacterium]|jgi:uncharacterized RDD family membrane protein YckC|nr:RDD family protein [Rhodanobacteraceae bacterium]